MLDKFDLMHFFSKVRNFIEIFDFFDNFEKSKKIERGSLLRYELFERNQVDGSPLVAMLVHR